MIYNLGDKFILASIECKVGFINAAGKAYLLPESDGDTYNNQFTYVGCVFAIIDQKGKDFLGNKAIPVTNKECGAV